MKWTSAILILILGLTSFYDTEPNEYPIPPDKRERLFYIQRNHNRNTIVYDANFDEQGNLNHKKPIDVYWIRYEEDGRRMELREIEKIFAYGVKCVEKNQPDSQFRVKIVAAEDRKFQLIQKNPFVADIHTSINKKPSILEHLYIFADNSGFWPKVKYIELFGRDAASGADNYEKITIQ